MSGLFGIINHGYSGTSANQQAVDVTAQNISNVDTDGYARERAVMTTKSPLFRGNLLTGDGVKVDTIERIHDEFVWHRYTTAQSENEYWNFQEDTMKRVGDIFPDLQDVGTFNELNNYFDAWSALEQNPTQPALKQNLADKANALIDILHSSREQMTSLQTETNKKIPTTVNRVNEILHQIADLNQSLYQKEINSHDINIRANELRDKRDSLEDELSQLIDVHVEKNTIQHTHTSRDVADFEDRYSLSLAGHVLIDGHHVHELEADASKNDANMYRILWDQGDGDKQNITRFIRYKGKLGAMIDTGGDLKYSFGQCGEKGKIQQAIDHLDSFAKGLIYETNRIYAQSSVKESRSNYLDGLDYQVPLTMSNYDIVPGHIDFAIYDDSGNKIATRSIELTDEDTIYTIEDKLNENFDDNNDNVDTNDWDDMFTAKYNEATGLFSILPKKPSQNYYFSIQDENTNFAGALGLNDFFKGTNAEDIDLSDYIKLHPDGITPNKTPVIGNFDIAQEMHQMQYNQIPFFQGRDKEYRSIDQYYRETVLYINDKAQDAIGKHQVSEATLNNAKQNQQSVSQVSLDEEFKNLVQYQSGYTANAKVVKTADEMIQTILALKN